MLKKVTSNFELKRSADKLGPKVLLVLVVSDDSTKVVVGCRNKEGFVVENTMILPRLDIDGGSIKEFCSSYGLPGHYCSVVVQKGKEYSRVTEVPSADLTKPGGMRETLQELFGLDGDYSLVYDVLDINRKTSVTSILAVGMALNVVEALHEQVLDAKKRPVSLMLSSVTLSTYLMDHYLKDEKPHAFLYVGSITSTFMVFQEGKLTLLRQFDNGIHHVLKSIEKEFGFDGDMACDLFENNSFDYTSCLDRFTSWFYQIGISLDYIERKGELRISSLNLFGFGSRAEIFQQVLSKAVKRSVSPIDTSLLFSDFLSPSAVEKIDGIEDFVVGIAECVNIMSGGLK
jgi:hypothetical protein